MARIFISHSSRDNIIADEIKAWLAARGFESVFLDFDKHSGIAPGADWEKTLYRRIDGAQAVILAVTPHWHESKWCFVEFAQARALGKAIFPIIVAPGGERFVAPDIQQLDLLRDREGGLERLARELTRLALDAQGGFEWDARRAPYPGLLAFEQEDAAVFFGRDDDTRRLIERLNAKRVQGEPKLIALLGASGAGKSSVVRAGVLPRLRRDARNWIIIPAFRPQRDPIAEFARAASEALGTPQHWRELRDRLASADGSRTLEDLADALRVRTGSREAHILVTIDQSEELFADRREDSEAFFRMIAWATAEPAPFIIFLVLRSDHLHRLQRAAEAISFEEISLGRFPLSRVRQIIEGPARVAGIHIDERLAAAAILDMGGEDALPLLAFAMREVFDSAMANRATQPASVLELSLVHYQVLGDVNSGLNPLENAVRKRADEVVDAAKLSAEAMNALREAFIGAMVRVDDDGQYLRRPALWHDLPERARPVLERLANARLLVISTDSGFPIVEVAHEALLRKWPRLREWLDQERDFLVGKAQLRYALNDWTAAATTQKHATLLRGLSLDRARQWLRDHANSLSELEQTYIKDSIVLDDFETHRKKRRRQLSWAAVTALVVLSIAALSLVQQRHAATVRADAAALAIQARSSLSQNPIRAAGLAAQAVEKSSVGRHTLDFAGKRSRHLTAFAEGPERHKSQAVIFGLGRQGRECPCGRLGTDHPMELGRRRARCGGPRGADRPGRTDRSVAMDGSGALLCGDARVRGHAGRSTRNVRRPGLCRAGLPIPGARRPCQGFHERRRDAHPGRETR